MKLFLPILCFCVSAYAYEAKAQQKPSILNARLHCSIAKGTVKQYLEYISRNTHTIIEYASNVLDAYKIASIDDNESDLTIGELLQYVLAAQKVAILEKDSKLIVIPSDHPYRVSHPVLQHTMFGFVQEEGSREPLIGATILDSSTGRGCATNSQGYYSFVIPAGRHTLYVSYVGYEPQQMQVSIDDNARKDYQLALKNQITYSATISTINGLKKDGALKTSGDKTELYNNIIGENDPVRERLMEPGVTGTQDINGILVRGGDPDQNLFLLDGNEVFNPTHILGALSIVNVTSLKSMQFYKNDFPARFDGGISSVTDVYTKDGNMDHWTGEANLGMLAGSATLEGPLVKNKLATMISYRQGWPNVLLRNLSKSCHYNFNDLHVKATYLLNSNNKLIASIYTGKDYMRKKGQDEDNVLQKWGNRVASLRWMHIWGTKCMMNLSLNTSHYNNLAGYQYSVSDSSDLPPVVFNTYFSIDHYNLKDQLELFVSNKYKINTGIKLAYTKINPFNFNVQSSFLDDPESFVAVKSLPYLDASMYFDNEIKLGGRLLVRPGVNFSAYKFRDNKFFFVQPRFFSSYRLSGTQQLYFSFSQTGQYLHMVSNPSLGINNNFWLPSTSIIQPEKGSLLNLGYTYSNAAKGFKLNTEAYWRKMNNIINYADGRQIDYDEDTWETDMQTGKGWSYGLELQVSKRIQKWQLKAGYALSWSWRRFDSINNNLKFPYKYDRRHQLNLMLSYSPGRHWDLSANWMFSSGDAYTTSFDPGSGIHDVYKNNDVNTARTQPIHRLNFAASYQFESHRLKHSIVAGIYNVYGSPDQYNYSLQTDANGLEATVPGARLFGITPYISYTLNF